MATHDQPNKIQSDKTGSHNLEEPIGSEADSSTDFLSLQYLNKTSGHKRLTHSAILQLQRTIGNQAVQRLLDSSSPILQRIPMPSTTSPTPDSLTQAPEVESSDDAYGEPLSFARFEEIMERRFGVSTIRVGTYDDQQAGIPQPRNMAPVQIDRNNWQSWNPGDTSQVYNEIIKSFDTMSSSIGLPPVQEILFFQIQYVLDQTQGQIVAQPSTGAAFGGTRLEVFQTFLTVNSPTGNLRMASQRSEGNTDAALDQSAGEMERTISHELAHGIGEMAAGLAAQQGSSFFADYGKVAGWIQGQVFDIGVPEVQQAANDGQIIPNIRQHRITPRNWNQSRWIEQPMSEYMISANVGEDFAEALKAYVHSPDVMASRCPSRFRFISQNFATWFPHLQHLPARQSQQPAGDFPVPNGDNRAV